MVSGTQTVRHFYKVDKYFAVGFGVLMRARRYGPLPLRWEGLIA